MKVFERKKMIEWIFYLSLLTVFLTAISYYSPYRQSGDTALFSQIIENIARTGRAESNIYANTGDYVERHIASISLDERLANSIYFSPPKEQSRSILSLHFCIILYLIAPLCYFLSSYTVVTLMQALSLALNLWFMILIMKEQDVPKKLIALSCCFIIAHPGWSYPAIYGSFYPERLFMATGSYLIWACCKKKFEKKHFVIAAVLCAMVGERGALYAGMFILAYTILYWNKKIEFHKGKLLVGVILLVYTIILMKFVLVNLYYSQIGSNLKSFYNYLSIPENQEKILLFLVINVGLFGIIAIFEWRAAVIGFASLIPNILYNVGGAEKVGWTLHYHVFYFVVLIWASVSGVIKLYQLTNKKKFPIVCSAYFVPFVLGSMITFLDPFDTSLKWNWSNGKNNIVYNGIKTFELTYITEGGWKEQYEGFNNIIGDVIPKSSKITAVEGAMPFLIDVQTVYIFPMGISNADYAIVSYTKDDSGYNFTGATSYFGEDEVNFLNQEIFNRMKNMYKFDFENIIFYEPYSMAIIPCNKK